MMKICLIDYGAGNLKSVYNAVNRVIHDNNLDALVTISHDIKTLEVADKIILPGVGAFKACIDGLKAHDGLVDMLNYKVLEKSITEEFNNNNIENHNLKNTSLF